MEKRCIRCGVIKPLSDYHLSRAEKDGHVGKCKPCVLDYQRERWWAHHDRLLEDQRARSKKPKARARARELQIARYGVTPEQREEMLERQGGRCAICGVAETGCAKRFGIDHCHKAGRVRGLLCSNCNTALGLLDDDPAILMNAILYLGAA